MSVLHWCTTFTLFYFLSLCVCVCVCVRARFWRIKSCGMLTPCRRVNSNRRFEGTAFRRNVATYQSTRHAVPELLNVQHYFTGRNKLCISAFLSRTYIYISVCVCVCVCVCARVCYILPGWKLLHDVETSKKINWKKNISYECGKLVVGSFRSFFRWLVVWPNVRSCKSELIFWQTERWHSSSRICTFLHLPSWRVWNEKL